MQSLIDTLHDEVLLQVDMTAPPEDDELRDIIFSVIKEHARTAHIPLKDQIRCGKALFHSFRKLDILEELLEDGTVTEIMVNGKDRIFIERGGGLMLSDKSFTSAERLDDVVQQIAAGSNRIVNEASPIVDARLSDGSRVNIVLPPVSLDGPAVTIRKFPKQPFTMQQLLRMESLTEEAAELLRKLVVARYNIFISGGTGSGKTTFLNVLSEFIPPDERIITIEDNAELRLLEKPNLVRLEARNKNTEGSGEIPIRELIRTALRMRPDRIIVGEVRQEEAIDMIQAMNTGHDGSISTGHGNSPKDMLARLETMILMGMDIPLASIQRQLASGIDILIHLGRLRDKSRKVLEIVETDGYRDGAVRLHTLFSYREGRLVRAGALKNTKKLEMAGVSESVS